MRDVVEPWEVRLVLIQALLRFDHNRGKSDLLKKRLGNQITRLRFSFAPKILLQASFAVKTAA